MRTASTAVLLMGFQNDFCSEEEALHGTVKGEIERLGTLKNAADLVSRAREKGVKILHVPMQFSEAYREIPENQVGVLEEIRGSDAFITGTEGADFVGELGPEPDDVVISGRSTISAFKSTNLDHVLRNFGITDLGLAGLLADVSVESTARAAYDLGYRIVLLSDCVAARSEDAKRSAENAIGSAFGEVMTYEEFLEELEKRH
ncbi:hypothetical protein AKJ41_04770 [candidate division MSBL1 archaeon SCGC-AAA259O05]|uniref:Isochorismatase-like domain-containing protein n=1 Tax=candidate division MSBL1 archaeon SCGC-AAA259O05 TaxID=1698271 RepID=A0A133V078_9EURY|nr:hypothetical protein AKJ41_04770 [candidate division MSBL1 archaeon SCGC-AAA259O05]